MSKKEFLHSTMRDINLRIENYREEKEYEVKKLDYLAWRIGTFTIPAVGMVLDTKHKVKYPKNPLEVEEVIVEDMELTEEEKIEWTNKLFSKLTSMANKHKNRSVGKG